MAFTTAELQNIANSALDYFIKGQPLSQTIQDKPLLKAMEGAKKKFPGGKENISGPVKGNYNTYFKGFEHDDTVTYGTPANDKRIQYNWKEMHAGLKITGSELKRDGLSVTDEKGIKTSSHSQRERTVLINILESKLEDMTEGMARDKNAYFWGDGTADAKGPAGVTAILTDTPNTGTTGGLDRATTAWWRHRAYVGDGTNATGTALASDVELPLFFKSEWRQLRRFGGSPKLWLAGSDMLEAMEKQLYNKGQFSNTGFNYKGKNDIGIADITFNGISIKYDPTLDDLGKSKRLYVIDTKHLFPYVMEGEDMKTHNPSRPHDKYVYYKAVTWTGNVYANQLNCHGVYELA